MSQSGIRPDLSPSTPSTYDESTELSTEIDDDEEEDATVFTEEDAGKDGKQVGNTLLEGDEAPQAEAPQRKFSELNRQFGVALNLISLFTYVIDVGSDVTLACVYVINGERVWGVWTMSFVLLPHVCFTFITLAILLQPYFCDEECSWTERWQSRGFLYCLCISIGAIPLVFIVAPLFPVFAVALVLLDYCKLLEGRWRLSDINQRATEFIKSWFRFLECMLESIPQVFLQLYIINFQGRVYGNTEVLQCVVVCLSVGSVAIAGPMLDRAGRARHQHPAGKPLARDAAIILRIISTIIMVGARAASIVLFVTIAHYYILILLVPQWVVFCLWSVIHVGSIPIENEDCIFAFMYFVMKCTLGPAAMLFGFYVHLFVPRPQREKMPKVTGIFNPTMKDFQKHLVWHCIVLLITNSIMISWWYYQVGSSAWYGMTALIVVSAGTFLGLAIEVIYSLCFYYTKDGEGVPSDVQLDAAAEAEPLDTSSIAKAPGDVEEVVLHDVTPMQNAEDAEDAKDVTPSSKHSGVLEPIPSVSQNVPEESTRA